MVKSRLLLIFSVSAFSFFKLIAENLQQQPEYVPAESFLLHDKGLKIELWARSPMLFNPTGMDVDAEGNIWVSESLNYRKFRKQNKPNASFTEGDRISVLRDTDGDGKADSSHVFVQDKELIAPLGVAVVDHKIFVSCSPSVIVYSDNNRNLKFDEGDEKEVFLTGFGGEDHDHSLHKMEVGPDGRFYINTGNAGPHRVKDRSNWQLNAKSWYGKKDTGTEASKGPLKSSDGRIYTGGVMLSINEDGTDMKVLGHNFRNPYGHSVDSFGSMWMNDNDDTQSCRTTWLMRYGNLGYNSADGSETWRAGKRPGQSTPTAHWRQDDPGVIPSGHIYGNASPTGMVYYEVGEGLLLSCEAGQNVIWGYHRKRKGAGFEMKGFPFLSSTGIQDPNYNWRDLPKDVNKWFRPSDIVVGTDGSIFISDWFDPTVGGHLQNERRGLGAIYRVSKIDGLESRPKYDFTCIEGAVDALSSPAVNVRYKARKSIFKLADRVAALAALKRDFKTLNPFVQARRLWLIADLKDLDFVLNVMRDHRSSTDLRVASYRALEKNTNDLMSLARQAAAIDDIALRREVLLSLRDVPYEQCSKLLVDLMSHYDGNDRWYLEAIGTAAENKEEQIFEHIRKDVEQWDDRFASIAWRLHPASAVESFKSRACDRKLKVEQRKAAMDALAFIDSQKAAQAMLEVYDKCEESLQEYCNWWLTNRQRNYWKSYLNEQDLKDLNKKQVVFNELKQSFLRNPNRELLAQLLSSKKGGMALLRMAIDDALPKDYRDKVENALLESNDKELRALAQTYLRSKVVEYNEAEILKMKGNSDRGKALFYGKAVCFSCHNVSGKGGDLGPELTAIKTKFNQKALLDAIVNPSSAILVGYESIRVILKDGKEIQGTLLSDKEPMIVRNVLGENVQIHQKNIKSKFISKDSIMPSASTMGLSQQELADILSYLNNIQ